MVDSIARKRAEMPKSTNSILNQRTLERDHKKLLQILEPGMFVLDVGCGRIGRQQWLKIILKY